MMQYFDKHSNEIKAGMFLRMEDGSIEEIYACTDAYGKEDLGINASNDEFLKRHGLGEFDREFYSLSRWLWDIDRFYNARQTRLRTRGGVPPTALHLRILAEAPDERQHLAIVGSGFPHNCDGVLVRRGVLSPTPVRQSCNGRR